VRRDPTIHFLFVNDGSNDSTQTLLESLAQHDPDHHQVLKIATNVGKAEAIRRGVLRVVGSHLLSNTASPSFGGQSNRHDRSAGEPSRVEIDAQAKPANEWPLVPAYVGYWDADLATPLDEIGRFRDILDVDCDLQVVLGSRHGLKRSGIQRNVVRHCLGRIFAASATWVLALPLHDTQCGAKLLRVSDVTREVFSRPFGSRWIFDVELLARLCVSARKNHHPAPECWFHECPLDCWRDIRGSKLNAIDLFGAIPGLFSILCRYRRPGAVSRRTAASDSESTPSRSRKRLTARRRI
jgi:dolichyl-phosphate beta-glucosyltransferase